MKTYTLLKLSYNEKCPRCSSTNLTRTADHSSHGYNGFICNDCGCNFGN